MAWQIDEDVPITATFTDVDGVLFDPDTVTLEFKNPVTDDITTFTWTSAVPGTDIERVSLGEFRALIRVTHKGFWHWVWTAEGAIVRVIQSSETTAIEVEARPF